MKIEAFFDQSSYTLTYIVIDTSSKKAIIIDPVLNFNSQSSTITHESIDKISNYITQNELEILYILETHAHADHLSGAQEIKKIHPNALVCISKGITQVQKTFKTIFNLSDLPIDGSQFERLLDEGDILNFGRLELKTILTPGHTPGCASFLIKDCVFTGDALFMPDFGTGRCDFPDGSAKNIYNSVHEKLYSLPNETKVYVGHDYQPGGRELKYQTSIQDSKLHNIHIKSSTTQESYISFREERDKTLLPPKLLFYSIQVNINAGKLPMKESNNFSFFKIPINTNT